MNAKRLAICMGTTFTLISAFASFDPLHARAEAPASDTTKVQSIVIGSTVADFHYQSTPYGWRQLNDLGNGSVVVLVLYPSDQELIALQQEKEALAALGMVPVAVVRRTDPEAWRAISRLKLRYSLLSDPHGVLAETLGVPGESIAQLPLWLVIDPQLRLRMAGSGGISSGEFAGRIAAAMPRPAGDALPRPSGAAVTQKQP